ncbi:cell division protein FtsQ [Flavobacterium agricola]|uniref:Cell division protein FtsQ n=1 Tax=Flavobacterium agricola TaxID=2870839 RepID=A0ABY6M0L0_9FLAO|nr:cell division protein FtsQ [Flavobacterium agricola]UYW00651.1 cell division protein FtsQ [Flavobacterium agricola]
MLKKIKWIDVRLILLFGVIYFLYSFSADKNASRRELQTRIDFVGEDNVYITESEVNKIIHENLSFKSNLDKNYKALHELENVLQNNDKIETVHVYKTIEGILVAQILQKEPVGRVFANGDSFYLDRNGNTMNTTSNYAARVPIVTGEINETTLKDVNFLLQKIHSDDFLKKSIIGVKIFPSRSVILTDRNFDFQIIFGNVTEVDKKFNNYKAFIQHTLQDSIVNNYKEVNLKFTQQVVCSK